MVALRHGRTQPATATSKSPRAAGDGRGRRGGEAETGRRRRESVRGEEGRRKERWPPVGGALGALEERRRRRRGAAVPVGGLVRPSVVRRRRGGVVSRDSSAPSALHCPHRLMTARRGRGWTDGRRRRGNQLELHTHPHRQTSSGAATSQPPLCPTTPLLLEAVNSGGVSAGHGCVRVSRPLVASPRLASPSSVLCPARSALR